MRSWLFAAIFLASLTLACPAHSQEKPKLDASQMLDQAWSYDFSRFTLSQALEFITKFQKRLGQSLSFQIEPSAKPFMDRRVPFKLDSEPLRAGLKRVCGKLGLIFWEKDGTVKIEFAGAPKPEKLVEKQATVLWTFDTKSPSYGSGAAADIDGDGKLEIVFGTYFNDEHIYAINAEDGSLLWKHKSAGGPFDASIAIADLDKDGQQEVLSADSATGMLFCLQGKTGKILWQLKLPSGTDSPIAVADIDGNGVLDIVVGTMWCRDKLGRVCAIRSDNRKFLWQAKVPGCVQSEPCLVELNGDGFIDVIVTSWRGDRSVRALSGKDGSLLWRYVTDGDKKSTGMYHGVALAKNKGVLGILASSCEGQIYCLDSKGQLKWTKKLPERLFAPPSVADINGDGIEELIQASNKQLWVLATDTGKLVWKRPLPAPCPRGAAVTDINGDGRADVLLGAGRRLLALDGPTGKELWRYEVKLGDSPYEGIDNAPLIGDFDNDGKLEVFFVAGKGHSGKTQKQNYGRAFCLRAGHGKASWLTFRGNLRRQGRRK